MASLLTNTSANVALQNLRSVNRNLAEVQQQISTGKEVSNARDNAAIFAVSSVIESDVKGFESISSSLDLANSSLSVARGAAETVTDLLTDIKGLVVSAQEDNVDRAKIQSDVSNLRDQINSIVESASFNGLNFLKGTGSTDFLSSLDRQSDGSVNASNISVNVQNLESTAGTAVAGAFDGTTTTGVNGGGDAAAQLVANTSVFALDVDSGATFTAGDVYEVNIGGRALSYTVQGGDTHDNVSQGLANAINAANISGVTVAHTAGGAGTDAQLDITNNTGDALAISARASDGNGGGLAALANLDVSTALGANSALADIENLIQVGIDASAEFGSAQNRVDVQSEFVTNLTTALREGIGALVDADLEEASARLQSLQVQQQLGTQALSIANQAPNSILGLFR